MALASLQPLRSRNFALIWFSALISNVGSWMQAVALGILVTAKTHNPLWTGLIAAAAFLPNGLLAPVGGALADRLDRRRWLIITTTAETGFAALLSVLAATGHASPPIAVLVAFFGGCASAVGFPTYQAMMPDLVERREDLFAAVLLSSAQFNLGRVIGPALAGVAIVAGSYSLAFAANAISFGAVIIALLLLRLPPRELPTEKHGIVSDVLDGAKVALAEPGCRSAIFLIGVVALVASPFIALVPAMAITALHLGSGHRGAVGTTVLVTAQGAGAVLGALALPGVARRVRPGAQVVSALFLLPILLALYGLAPNLALSAVALFFLGLGYLAVLSGLNTVVQLRAPELHRGRVLSFFMFALGTLYPIGAVIEGAIGRAVGVRTVTFGAGVLFFVVLGAVVLRSPDTLEKLRPPEAEGETSLGDEGVTQQAAGPG